MPSLLRKNPSSLQEKVIQSLINVNDRGQLTYLIKELNERKINQEAEVFIFLLLCLSCHPELINHPKRQKLENCLDSCWNVLSPQALADILERPENSKIKPLLSDYLRQAVEQPAQRKNHALDTFVQFVLEQNHPQNKITHFLLQDYLQFAREKEKAAKVEKSQRKRL